MKRRYGLVALAIAVFSLGVATQLLARMLEDPARAPLEQTAARR